MGKNKDKKAKQKSAYLEKQQTGGQYLLSLDENLKGKLGQILNGAIANIDGKTLRKETGLQLKEIYSLHNFGKGYKSSVERVEAFLQSVDLD